jgi:hypothetical protein
VRATRKIRVLQIATERIGGCDGIDISVEPKNAQDGRVSAHGYAHPAAFDIA